MSSSKSVEAKPGVPSTVVQGNGNRVDSKSSVGLIVGDNNVVENSTVEKIIGSNNVVRNSNVGLVQGDDMVLDGVHMG